VESVGKEPAPVAEKRAREEERETQRLHATMSSHLQVKPLAAMPPRAAEIYDADEADDAALARLKVQQRVEEVCRVVEGEVCSLWGFGWACVRQGDSSTPLALLFAA
jgi:hypothetical protein